MRCRRHPETSHRDPAGGKPVQSSLTSGWKRVLRGARVTRTAKRGPPVRKPGYGAPKDLSWEPSLFGSQGPCRGTAMVWCPRSCRRRRNRANGQSGSSRNLGDPVASSARSRPGDRVNNSGPRRGARPPGSERTSGRGGTAGRRQRSAAGRAAGGRSALRVPSKRGNSPRRTPWREARRQSADPTEGNRLNPSRFIRRSTGLGRIATGTLRGWRNCRLRNRML